jgi:hypothetical protein
MKTALRFAILITVIIQPAELPVQICITQDDSGLAALASQLVDQNLLQSCMSRPSCILFTAWSPVSTVA